MFHNQAAIRQLLRVLAGEIALTLLMVLVYAVIGKLDLSVALGAVIGTVLAMGNFLALSMVVSRAADMAEQTGKSDRATLLVRASAPVRLLVLAGIYILLLRTDRFDPIASILPLVFVQLSITLTEYFRKDGGKEK